MQAKAIDGRSQLQRDLVLAAATGIVFGLSFPPFRLGFLAYWALVPYFFLLSGRRLAEVVRWSYLVGLFVHLSTLYWIGWVTVPGAVAAILFLPLFFVLFGLGFHFLEKRLCAAFIYAIPFWWTGIEYARSLGQIGFPWISLGYTQSYYNLLIQYASVTSVFGVSFWVVWLNVLVYEFIRSLGKPAKCARILVAILLLFALPILHGLWVGRNQPEATEKVRVALIQGNIDPYLKWDTSFLRQNFSTYERLTGEVISRDPDLIVWPETAVPTYVRYDNYYLDWMYEHVEQWGIPLLTGAPDYRYTEDGEPQTFNAAFLFLPQSRQLQWYAKMQLVPFGERVPYQGALGWFKKLLDKLEMGEGDFSPGPGVSLFELPAHGDSASMSESVTFGTVICFESVFPDLVQRFVKQGAEFLVVITNDGWFGRTSGPYQHAQAAVFRAIENRIWIARCANTGVSSFIDAYGRVLQESPLYREATLWQDIGLRRQETFFSRHGNVFSWTISLLNVLPFGLAARARQANGTPSEN